MGLFIGASILTILEIFDYIYEVSKLLSFDASCTRTHPHGKSFCILAEGRLFDAWLTGLLLKASF